MNPAIIDAVFFYVFAGLALGSAVMVVAQRNPTYSAFSLIVTLCSMAALFGLLGSPFIAALQVIVYAGAIMVLFLFVLMLLNVQSEERMPGEGWTLKAVAVALVAILTAQSSMVVLRVFRGELAPDFSASTVTMARALFQDPQYLYVFEATSVLILAALVGAIALSKRDL
jgi:NADH-quinone oxidoreductase subunit J